MTAHVVLMNDTSHDQEQRINNSLKHELSHKNIQHVTIETELESEVCVTEVC